MSWALSKITFKKWNQGLALIPIFFSFFTLAQKLPTDGDEIIDFKKLHKNELSVIIFFDPECPICQKYTKNLTEFDEQFSKENIKLYVVYPFKPIDKNVLAEFREEYRFKLPIIYDSKRQLLKKLNANFTPEVFLVDKRNKIRYHGAIDNWFYGLGRNRAAPTEFYLLDAISALKNHQKIKKKYIEPVGCGL
ncbi:alkyl hydroperoxide reductase/ Thiol specific antioxidant/ Mal allergen [Emticicia oligotrophica DSM 17448]|uniref:Alkyl hydroperoxide reductase/ Thiol specific antioxidant/ Mal allergen n=1 Tax=Emticicia oligotrophica (strain DSM 17448 / CIP 109782 / MTCC 6937 / GPTSA100-15) TaxID=929562 RepID=A0ABM5N3Z4_EMTOG|nr:redoxin domain-containing protein [Emticicia oligotrophica]AFK04198.1 alkyl hydroperoxide reductase/ Thiol specific antioxidant/ Mal allergen [Emticicia oligotrophica DSM 17448]